MWGNSIKKDDFKTLTLTLLEKMLPPERPFAVRLWDGTVLPASVDPPRAALVIKESGQPWAGCSSLP